MKKRDYTLNEQQLTEQLQDTIELLPKESIPIAEQLIEEILFMRELLDEVKENLKAEGSVNMFNNGKQSNTRQTPEFKTYMDLSNRYKQYMKDLRELYSKVELETEETDSTARLLAEFMASN